MQETDRRRGVFDCESDFHVPEIVGFDRAVGISSLEALVFIEMEERNFAQAVRLEPTERVLAAGWTATGDDERGKPRFVPSQDGLARIWDFRNFLQMAFVEEPHEFWIFHIVETERNMEIELGHIFEFVVSAIAFPDDFAQGNVGLADNVIEIDIDGHRRESGRYSTVTDFARFRGWSIGSPRKRAM